MSVYDDLVRYAYKLVEILVNDDIKELKESMDPTTIMARITMQMFLLLEGIGPHRVEHNGSGHNYQAVMDAIHDYYRVNKVEIIPPNFFDALLLFCDTSKSFENVQSTFDFISYQLYKEKECSATFQVDCAAVLDKLYQTICENHDALVAEMPNFDSWIREKSSYLRSTYGIRWDDRGF